MGILDRINSPADIKKLTDEELEQLSGEIRSFLIESTSKTGGHIASNLGVVELTLVIHLLFDTTKDKLLFDVGHQSYVHKILTGRKDAFSGLRTFGGISGFPKPNESIHDAFVAGHASSVVSTALGMAKARTLTGEDYNVIAVVGDGAMTGGLCYEGLCNAGDSDEPLIVILNDNGMSINKNVGGMARYLSHARLKRGYISFKNFYRRLTKKLPGGLKIYKFTHKIKQAIKEAVFQCSMFEDMGFTYVGPVDGHNIKQLISALKIARDSKCPVLVHVITKKGKGYAPAEANPDAFHGVSGFDAATGFVPTAKENFSSVFGKELIELAKRNEKIVAVTAAMPSGTGLTEFSRQFPDRFFDVGIAEGHAVSMAGGAAAAGLVPVVAIYSTFLQRSYDMLLQDVSLGNEHVVLAVDRAGLVGEDGETHQGIFDVPYLSSVPNMTIYSPASFAELRDMLDCAINSVDGPVAVRYPRGAEGAYSDGGCFSSRTLCTGSDFTIITYGINVNTALAAKSILESHGVSVEILKLGRIKPIDFAAVDASANKTGNVLVLEECVADGCIGDRLAAHFAERGIRLNNLILKNLGDRFIQHGRVSKLREFCGIDERTISVDILHALGRDTEL